MNKNIECLVAALDELGMSYSFIDENQTLVRVGKYFFAKGITPLDNATTTEIAKDKGYTYNLLNTHIRMPRTSFFLDPDAPHHNARAGSNVSREDIVKHIDYEFQYPCIVKRGRGYLASNVFVCTSRDAVTKAVAHIFDHDSKQYDYTLLAQEYIDGAKEYRLIVLDGKIELAYEKNMLGKPRNESVPVIDDATKLKQFGEFIKPLFEHISLRYGGLDIIEDKEGAFWFLEINGHPRYEHFLKHNSSELIFSIYRKILHVL